MRFAPRQRCITAIDATVISTSTSSIGPDVHSLLAASETLLGAPLNDQAQHGCEHDLISGTTTATNRRARLQEQPPTHSRRRALGALDGRREALSTAAGQHAGPRRQRSCAGHARCLQGRARRRQGLLHGDHNHDAPQCQRERVLGLLGQQDPPPEEGRWHPALAQGHPVRLPALRLRGLAEGLPQEVGAREPGAVQLCRHLPRRHGQQQQVQQDSQGQAPDRAPRRREHGHGVLAGQRGAHEHDAEL